MINYSNLRKALWLIVHGLDQFTLSSRKRILFSKNKWEPLIDKWRRCFRHDFQFATLSDVVDASSFDAVIPLCESSYRAAINNSHLKGKLFAPSLEAFETCNNKEAFYQRFSKSPLKKFLPSRDPRVFPKIIKPSVGGNSNGCRLLLTADDLAVTAQQHQGDHLSEVYVPGNSEYAAHVIAVDGKIIKTLTIEYRFPHTTPIKTLDAPVLKTIVREHHADLLSEFVAELDYTGICCFNYKLQDSSPVVFEINPRVGGSFCEYLFGYAKYIELPCFEN